MRSKKEKKAKRTKFPYVYRVSYPSQSVDGYLAKVVRRDGTLHKVFQLSKYDGKHAECLKAALSAVRAFVKTHPLLSRRELAQLPRGKKDRDLPTGVRRVKHRVAGRVYGFFEAQWSPVPNQQRKQRFSVDRYGKAIALKKAIAARRRGLAEMKG